MKLAHLQEPLAGRDRRPTGRRSERREDARPAPRLRELSRGKRGRRDAPSPWRTRGFPGTCANSCAAANRPCAAAGAALGHAEAIHRLRRRACGAGRRTRRPERPARALEGAYPPSGQVLPHRAQLEQARRQHGPCGSRERARRAALRLLARRPRGARALSQTDQDAGLRGGGRLHHRQILQGRETRERLRRHHGLYGLPTTSRRARCSDPPLWAACSWARTSTPPTPSGPYIVTADEVPNPESLRGAMPGKRRDAPG